MVDIHCHILPELDDGAASIQQSVEMAEIAIADGITHVVATPHCNGEYRFDPDLVRQRQNELQERIGGRLTLGTGCDFHLSYENIQDLRMYPAKYTINQKNYLLVEFADFAIPPAAEDTLYELQLLGLSPIITHPERNRLIRSNPDRLRGWLHQGCYVQVTAQSLLGRWGEGTRKQVEQWLDERIVHFVASDAHNVKERPLKLREAYEAISGRWGESVAEALFKTNPLAAFEGHALPYAPEQPEVAARQGASRRKRFLFF